MANNNTIMFGLDYIIDIVICVDATNSMLPFINDLKANINSFYKNFIEELEYDAHSAQQVRVKVIAFCDDGIYPRQIIESKFYTLNEENDELCKFVEGIKPISNGRYSNPFATLALAMKSNWERRGGVKRHIIIMYTDAFSLPLDARAEQVDNPMDMSQSIDELKELWNVFMEKRAKRLLLFAPDVAPWSGMAEWANVTHIVSKAGAGCDDTDIQTCIALLVGVI